MPRKNIIRTDQFPYHVTARSNNREFFYLPISEVWQIMLNSIARVKSMDRFELHQFVLMSNHYHMLISTPDANIDRIIFLFNLYTTRAIQKRSRRINHIFGNRYHSSIVKDRAYLYQVFKYIYLNPVQAKIVTKAENYSFSTLKYIVQEIHSEKKNRLGTKKTFKENKGDEMEPTSNTEGIRGPFPAGFLLGDYALLEADKDEKFNLSQFLKWLNHDFNEEQRLSIKNGLRKMEFEFSQSRNERRPIDFLNPF